MTAAVVSAGLAPFGASLGAGGYIVRHDGVATGVRVVQKGRRFRFESGDGLLMASGPATAQAVDKFVRAFWFWGPRVPQAPVAPLVPQ